MWWVVSREAKPRPAPKPSWILSTTIPGLQVLHYRPWMLGSEIEKGPSNNPSRIIESWCRHIYVGKKLDIFDFLPIFVLKICKAWISSKRSSSKRCFFCQILGYLRLSCMSTCPLQRFCIYWSVRAEGAMLNVLNAPALLVLLIQIPWIKARTLDQNQPGVQRVGAVNQVKHASSFKNSLLVFHTLGRQHYTPCFDFCCSEFCFGNRSHNVEFWLNAIQTLCLVFCGSFIVFELSCYRIRSKDWWTIKNLLRRSSQWPCEQRSYPKPSCYILVLKICKAWISSKRSSSKRNCSVNPWIFAAELYVIM